jgi:hypothetical protein
VASSSSAKPGPSGTETLHRGTAEQVRVETLTALDVAKELHGMVVGCSNQIVIGTPPRNLEVMLETLRDQR